MIKQKKAKNKTKRKMNRLIEKKKEEKNVD